VRQQARRDLLSESRKHPAVKLLRQIPSIGSDSCSLAGCAAADAPPFPYQAPAVGLQWFRAGDPRQRRVPLCQRETATKPGAHDRAWPE
jgi:hypothetical protein